MHEDGHSEDGHSRDGHREDAGNGRLASAISNRVVQVFAEYAGRGPTKARTLVTSGLIAVVLEDTLTRAEHKMIEKDAGHVVYEARKAMQQTMREDLVGAIESLTGRRVIAFLSDHHLDPDVAIENFVLEGPDAT
jgi:uncharacterized protein YbcI